MKITKRQLRETIREILLENTAGYDKIATLLVEGTLDSIKQGIELAEAMGYAHNVEYKATEVLVTYHNEVDRMVHVWSISVPQDLQAIILNKWSSTPKSAIPYTQIYPKSNRGGIGIKLTETMV